MPNDFGGPGPSVHLLRSVARDFEALSELIGQTLEVMDGESSETMASLHRARTAADKGAALAKRPANFR